MRRITEVSLTGENDTAASRCSCRAPIHKSATRLLLAALALMLPACAVVPVEEEPPVPYPASVRDRLVRIALAEWEEWGRQFTGHTGTVAGAPAAAGRTEDMVEAFPALVAYWSFVPGSDATIARNRASLRIVVSDPARAPALWADLPWSAAFLSFALRAAGYDAVDVPAAPAHWIVVDHLLARAARWPETAAFLPRSPDAYAPAPGDILCATRAEARGRYAGPAGRSADMGGAVPMHCDIVVGAREGVVEAIGGNLGDTVRMSLLPADPTGRLYESAPPEAPEMPAWFVVFENRARRR
jgi:hypothetical protein